MYCRNCGSEIAENAAVCIHCGVMIEQPKPPQETHASAGWWFLGFFIPVAGLLLFIIWHDEHPKRAKKAGIGALVSTILSVVGFVFYYFLLISLFMFM